MEIVRSQRKTSATEVVPSLPLYRSALALEVRLEDFELFAIDRLRGMPSVRAGLIFSLSLSVLGIYFIHFF